MAERKEGVEMPFFGNNTDWDTRALWGNYIIGTKFTIPEDGIADSIEMYFYAYIGSGVPPIKVKCAIYRSSDGVLMDSTKEMDITNSCKWWKFDFITQPTLEANTEYILAHWGGNRMCYYLKNAFRSVYKSAVYDGNFPSQITWNGTDGIYLIYCNYAKIEPKLTIISSGVE